MDCQGVQTLAILAEDIRDGNRHAGHAQFVLFLRRFSGILTYVWRSLRFGQVAQPMWNLIRPRISARISVRIRLVQSWTTYTAYSCRTEVKVPAKNLIGKEQFQQINVWRCLICLAMFQESKTHETSLGFWRFWTRHILPKGAFAAGTLESGKGMTSL